jgi:RNA polymerase sigma-70 factor (ECF subfamily)
MSRDEEADMVRRVAGGDRAAFRVLLERHQRPLSAYARRMLSDTSAADDIVQETFLRLWTRAGSYDSNAARLSTWLHNIAHNLCVDSFRRNSRITSIANEDEGESIAPGPLEAREAAQQSDRVRAALESLPERQRSALLLCYYQGLSNRDVASILEVSVDALESLLARARRKLKTDLEIDHGC